MSIPPDIRSATETHLGHAAPGSAFDILALHLSSLPPGLARAVGSTIPARDRTRIPSIRRRRHLYASGSPRPPSLAAEQGRLRWPLLWERLGGDPRVLSATAAQRDEAAWAENDFMPGRERFVGRLGRMLAEEEEIREWQEARDARARERRLDMQGEEFDDESDDEEMDTSGSAPAPAPGPAAQPNGHPGPPQSAAPGNEDQGGVIDEFERQLLELFLDGLDTIDYDEVDFSEPPRDPIRERDEEEAWFDDEAPELSAHASGTSNANALPGPPSGAAARAMMANVHANVSAHPTGRASGTGSGAVGSGGGTIATSQSGSAPAAAPNGRTANGTSAPNGATNSVRSNGSVPNGAGRFESENGQGEYDY